MDILKNSRWFIFTFILSIILHTGIAARPAMAQAGAGQSAVILNYQRFNDDRYPDTSVPSAQFDSQIGTLAGGRYNVVRLDEAMAALFGGTALPNRSVAISIDDAYRSAYEVAWPRLKKAGLPFTLFVSTDSIDDGGPGFMTWDQIRELKAAGVAIGAHGAAHLHMAGLSPDEIYADIAHSIRRIEEELGERPVLFSYPHGEMTLAARDIVISSGFTAAFGQHSGTVNTLLDRFMLPRFSINGKYGIKSEFAKRIDTLGLPLRDVTPADPYIVQDGPPTIAFTVDESLGRVRKLHCFHSSPNEDFIEISPFAVGEGRYELRFEQAFPPGPWRVNCTIPTGGKRYRWWGMQYYSARR